MTVTQFFAELIGGDEAVEARERLCRVITSEIANVGTWLGLDSYLGAGDVVDTSTEPAPSDPERVSSFMAVGLVAQISAELIAGALTLFEEDNLYGASALVRQLIECDYLLRAFKANFAEAARWQDANDHERWDFRPSKLRKLGGFDDAEYARHCDMGGHPNPAGAQLLFQPQKMTTRQRKAAGEKDDVDQTRVLWLDFTFHCDRVWRALEELLIAEHARFATVRSAAVSQVAEARRSWQDTDPLSDLAPLILAALRTDPGMTLEALVEDL
jgi:hypothetical protein